ncbi:uncharacterized protein TRIADDRAFT_54230 [Trichoplax adhaerens]|uniref:PDZ domain-containing protein n=1 Tax=Trichoplax adhaerens TaxID=10228 RepID=B3RRG6_TRIAD|nr:hypothetical protein TRIADDRAFT_54230 [Trichoplax adhaerens]EDV26871.1 hypothetical protein TRIADDRAFT_54230 [Trichoplax adhaerens]|eukprot:XP_002110867.1 hypothetical protein TRIADDRAFT_54230 [Trichoplax adhaerens]
MVMKEYTVNTRDINLYYLKMEVKQQEDAELKWISLENDSLILEILSTTAHAKPSFQLAVKEGKLIKIYGYVLAPEADYKTLIVSEETKAYNVVRMVLASYKSNESPNHFCLHEVSQKHRIDRIIMDDECPVAIQDIWGKSANATLHLCRKAYDFDQGKYQPDNSDGANLQLLRRARLARPPKISSNAKSASIDYDGFESNGGSSSNQSSIIYRNPHSEKRCRRCSEQFHDKVFKKIVTGIQDITLATTHTNNDGDSGYQVSGQCTPVSSSTTSPCAGSLANVSIDTLDLGSCGEDDRQPEVFDITNAAIIIDPPPEFATSINQQLDGDDLKNQTPKIIETVTINSAETENLKQNDINQLHEVTKSRQKTENDVVEGNKLLCPPQASLPAPIRKMSLNSLLDMKKAENKDAKFNETLSVGSQTKPLNAMELLMTSQLTLNLHSILGQRRHFLAITILQHQYNHQQQQESNIVGIEFCQKSSSDVDSYSLRRGIYIIKIDENGVIGRDGQLLVGDEIVEVNGEFVMATSIKVVEDTFNAAISHLGLLELVISREMNFKTNYASHISNLEDHNVNTVVDEQIKNLESTLSDSQDEKRMLQLKIKMLDLQLQHAEMEIEKKNREIAKMRLSNSNHKNSLSKRNYQVSKRSSIKRSARDKKMAPTGSDENLLQ